MYDQAYISNKRRTRSIYEYYIKKCIIHKLDQYHINMYVLVCMLFDVPYGGNKDEHTVERSRTTHDLIVYCEEYIIIVDCVYLHACTEKKLYLLRSYFICPFFIIIVTQYTMHIMLQTQSHSLRSNALL